MNSGWSSTNPLGEPFPIPCLSCLLVKILCFCCFFLLHFLLSTMMMTPQVNHFIFHVFRFAFHFFRVRWSKYDPFVVFFLDFLTSMMIQIWNYISATLRIWEAICWMAEGGSKKRCYCRSRKRTRSAAKRFARGAPFVRFNTTTWQRTFDPIVKLLEFIVILSMKVFCIQTWWAGPLFDWYRRWGGKIKLKLQIPTLPPTTMNTWWITLSYVVWTAMEKLPRCTWRQQSMPPSTWCSTRDTPLLSTMSSSILLCRWVEHFYDHL